MKLTFEQDGDSKAITLQELNEFESFIGHELPEDYRQHMLKHNGSMVVEYVEHVNYRGEGEGISYFFPIKYGSDTIENVISDLNGIIPSGYLCIGKTNNGAYIILSLNNDDTFGNTKEWFEDGDAFDLSPSFSQLLNDMTETGENVEEA